MAESPEITWADKIPRWRAMSEAMLANVEAWKAERDEFVDENLPGFIDDMKSSLENAKATLKSETFIELNCSVEEFRLNQALFFGLRDYYFNNSDYRVSLEITDDHEFDDQAAHTTQPTQFWLKLKLSWGDADQNSKT